MPVRRGNVGAVAAAVLSLVVCFGFAGSSALATCQPKDMGDGWPVSSPDKQQLDPNLICGIETRLNQLPDASANGVVVARHGVLVYEAYFTGRDQRWPDQHWKEPLPTLPHDAATKHDLSSITKSVVSLLVGIAADRGFITTPDASVLSFFPDYADLAASGRDRIAISHLLTMTSGLAWPYKPYLGMHRRMVAASDPYRFVLEQAVVAAPGMRWHYNNGSVEVMAGLLQRATGRPLAAFAKEMLFDRLGITDWEWERMASGNPVAAGGLRLRPRDLAKIGQLVLDNGTWHGEQIVSAAWIRQMTSAQVVRPGFSYGYLWWLADSSIGGRKVHMIYGDGWGGQGLYVVPSLGLVVVVTAGVYDFDGQGNQDLAASTVLDKFVLPAAD